MKKQIISLRRVAAPLLTVAAGFLSLAALAPRAHAQAASVPIHNESSGGSSEISRAFLANLEKFEASGQALHYAAVSNQLRRTTCELQLPPPHEAPLTGRQAWAVASGANLAVGTFYRATKVEGYQLGLAGGFPITEDGVIVTCYHIVETLTQNPQAALVVANEKNEIIPVKEILAASPALDLCLLKVSAPTNFQPLSLQTNVFPGDACYCYSAPYGIKGFFSSGIVNRFVHPLTPKGKHGQLMVNHKSTRLIVSTDWAQGSSGSAVIDNCGNAIGYVRAIEAMPNKDQIEDTNAPPETLLVIHEAVSAKDVLSLIHEKK